MLKLNMSSRLFSYYYSVIIDNFEKIKVFFLFFDFLTFVFSPLR